MTGRCDKKRSEQEEEEKQREKEEQKKEGGRLRLEFAINFILQLSLLVFSHLFAKDLI